MSSVRKVGIIHTYQSNGSLSDCLSYNLKYGSMEKCPYDKLKGSIRDQKSSHTPTTLNSSSNPYSKQSSDSIVKLLEQYWKHIGYNCMNDPVIRIFVLYPIDFTIEHNRNEQSPTAQLILLVFCILFIQPGYT